MTISDSFEQEHWASHRLVFGVDEAGMGCIAGSMFVGAAMFPQDYDFSKKLSGVNDSKKLSAKKRFALESIVKEESLHWFCSEITAATVDLETAYHARLTEAARRIFAFDQLDKNPKKFCVLMDGNVKIDMSPRPWIPSFCMVKGDAKSYTLAAASILAKCAKDREMIELDKEYPGYHWASNKGYGTKNHYAGIEKLGLSPHHRRTYCKKYLKE